MVETFPKVRPLDVAWDILAGLKTNATLIIPNTFSGVLVLLDDGACGDPAAGSSTEVTATRMRAGVSKSGGLDWLVMHPGMLYYVL